MKKLLSVLVLLLCGLALKAQYSPYYNPYMAAEIAGESIAKNEQIRQLNNVRFDEKALKENPVAWGEYCNYLNRNKEYDQKSDVWSFTLYMGLGLSAISLIPILSANHSNSDSLTNLGIGLCAGGCTLMLIGEVGIAVLKDRQRENKENFIFYLKTTNNGVGIVTLF